MNQQPEVLSEILALAGRHDPREIEAARDYVRARFSGTELDSYLTILRGLDGLHASLPPPREAIASPATGGAHSSNRGAKRAPRSEAVPDAETMRRELMAMLADSDFIKSIDTNSTAAGRSIPRVLDKSVHDYLTGYEAFEQAMLAAGLDPRTPGSYDQQTALPGLHAHGTPLERARKMMTLGYARDLLAEDPELLYAPLIDVYNAVYNAVRRDYLRYRSSNLNSIAKLINEEEP